MPRRAPDGTVASLRRDGGLLHLQTALAPVPCLPSPPETQGAFSTSPELDTGMMLEDNDDLPNEDPNAPQEDTALGRGIDSLSVLSELPEALANMSEGGDKGEQLVKQEAAGPDPTSYSRASSLSSLSTLEDSDDPDQRSVTPTQRRARRQSTRLVKASASSASTSKKRKSIAPEGSAKRVKRSKSYKREAVEWPARTGEIGEFQRTFIQCDKCDSWYHYGCVGIVLGDPRLRADSTEMFVCPPCDSGVVNGNKGRKGKKVGEEFVVERLVGRRERKEEGRKGFLWLIQWEGYPISQATWTPEEHMGYFAKLQEDFYEAAAAEGLDVDDDTQTLLLQDATDGGWQ
ncbi:hypothetical protein PLICRDRAFT_639769 [Plicaturopsis crispa FD-325 SS-3]|nr:hypothetical protein PLICRDRAFT_639769 [Plicaturopsis crispa FD-325 SS-3]